MRGLRVFCEIELKNVPSRVHFAAFLSLERFQKRQDEKCSNILEPGRGETFFGEAKKTIKLDQKKFGIWKGAELVPYRDSFEANCAPIDVFWGVAREMLKISRF